MGIVTLLPPCSDFLFGSTFSSKVDWVVSDLPFVVALLGQFFLPLLVIPTYHLRHLKVKAPNLACDKKDNTRTFPGFCFSPVLTNVTGRI